MPPSKLILARMNIKVAFLPNACAAEQLGSGQAVTTFEVGQKVRI